MDDTQRLDDSFMDDRFELDGEQARKPLAKLKVFKNEHIPETELPLYLGENVMGRDPISCSLLLDARSVSKRHAVISLSVFPGDRIHVSPVVEALVWDLGSMNGTRKGRFRLTPHVRYALTDGDSVALADLPCQYIDTSEVLREGSAEPRRVAEGGKLPAKDRGRSLRTRRGKESESKEGGWSNGIKNTNLKGNVKAERIGGEMVTPSVVRNMSLSLAQTPACPENVRVLELDSDSDDSTRARKGPTCSTFLSPMSSIVPESEDENSVTPASSVKDNIRQRTNQGGKVPDTPQMLVYDSDSEFEERETSRKKDSTTGLGDVANEQEGLPEGMAVDATPNGRAGPSGNVRMDKGEAGLSPDVPRPGRQVSSGGGSHTADSEEERKEPPQRSDPHSLGNNEANKSSAHDDPGASKPSSSMDSDTDVEGQEVSEQVLGPASGTEATDSTCKSSRTSMVQPEEFHLDSDTDVEDNEDNAPVSPSTSSRNVKPSPATVILPTEFHLDSDTDSKGSEDSPGDLAPPNPKPSTGLTEPVLVKCPGLHLSSDTDDEDTDDDPFATSVRETRGKRGTPQPAGGREVDLKIDSSSDSDVESSATQLFAFTSKPELASLLQPASHSSPLRGSAQGSPSDSDTDAEEPGSARPGPGPRLPAVHLCLESDTDVEDGGEDGVADTVDGTDVLPVVAGGAMASGVADQKCSTPVTLRPPIPPVFPSRPSEGDQDDLKDDDLFIAETQPFVSEASGGSSTGGPAAKRPCMPNSIPPSEPSSPPGFEEQPTMVYSGHEHPGSSLGLVAEDELSATQAYAAHTVTISGVTVELDRELEATQAYIIEAAGEADEAIQICADDIMNIQEVEGGGDHQRDFQANSHLSTADTQPVSVLEAVGVAEVVPEEQEDDEGVKRSQSKRQRESGRGNEEDKQPGRSARRRRAAVDQEPQKRETRRISKAGGMGEGDGSRRKAVPDEDVESDMEEDESVQETSRGTRRTRGRKSQKKGKDRVMMSRGTEGNEGDEIRGEEREDGKKYERKRKEQEEREERKRLENERKEQEEREERERLENERKEQEEREERERLENERKEQEEREERERLENERKEQEEREERERQEEERKAQEEKEKRERLDKERKEQEEREERERLDKERKDQEEREERERLEEERKEQEEKEERERLDKERKDQEEKEERERLEKKRLEKERKEREERKKLETERKEREALEKEKERVEKEERERLEKERKEQERLEKEKEWEERQERERLEAERKERKRLKIRKEQEEREERERQEQERKEQEEREERERLEKEMKEQEEREERERLEKERKEQEEREERERLEKERKEQEEREERERLEKERKEQEEREGRERLDKERKEQEEREERERLEAERKEQEEREERERLEKERKEQEAREERERLEREQERKKNVRKGKEKLGEQVKEDEEGLMKEKKIERKSARGKRKQEHVCKEREKDEEEEEEEEEEHRSSSLARGKRTRGGLAVSADEPRPCNNDTAMPEPEPRRGTRASSRCSFVASVSSERSTSSFGTQESRHLRTGQKGNGQSGYTPLGMQGEGNLVSSGGMGSCAASNSMGTSAEMAMQTENAQENTRSSTSKGADMEDTETHRSSAKASQVLDRDVPGPSMNDGGDCKGGKVSHSDTATTEADQTIKDSEADGGKVLPSRSKSRSRSQKQVLKAVLDEANSFKVPVERRKSQRGGKRRGEELDGDETGVEEEIPQPAVRKGTSGAASTKKMKQEEREEDQKEEQDSTGSVQLKSRGRQRKKESQVEMSEEQETKDEALDPTSEQDGPGVDTEVPQTPVGRGSRKRVASSKSPLAVKTPRRTSVQATSPAVLSASPQAPKVLFTCVTDEAGEAALSRLGGSLARGVADMTHLVTDRVRRTVKFLCAVARGVPVVTPCWLEKCSKNGAFLSPQAFLVKDVEQEKKFNFCLEEALQTARAQPLLQGYEIHVTRSVKPDPAQMKDIITCSGARYLSRMPTVLKPQTVVISCAEDASLCGPALAASIPVLSAEFLLTGILQQQVDLVTHSLVGTGFGAPENETPRGRRKR